MAELFDYSPVADNNNQAPPNGFPEGMAPSAVNNAAREVMAVMARAYQAFGAFPQVNGNDTAFGLTVQQNITSYTEGQAFGFRATNTNAPGPTLNVNGVGAVPMVNNRRDVLTAGTVVAGAPYIAVYNGTQFVLINIAFTIGTDAGDLVSLPANNTLPALSGANLTALNAAQLTDGIIPGARFASGQNAFGSRTISTAAASGSGTNGDIWYQYIP